MKKLASLVALLFFLALVGCGDGESSPSGDTPATKEGRTKAALLDLFAAAREGDNAGAARRIVYRGSDAERNWKALSDYSDEEDKRRVDRICARIKKMIEGETPEFLAFRSERESEGEWLVWKVKTSRDTAEFACLDVGGTIALGDID